MTSLPVLAGWLTVVLGLELRALLRLAQSVDLIRTRVTPEMLKNSPEALVSIVIPARNEERDIGTCVRAALEQSHTRTQVIVLNDGSTDGTGAVLGALRNARASGHRWWSRSVAARLGR